MSAFIVMFLQAAVLAVFYAIGVAVLSPLLFLYLAGRRMVASEVQSGGLIFLIGEAIDMAKQGASKLCEVIEWVI